MMEDLFEFSGPCRWGISDERKRRTDDDDEQEILVVTFARPIQVAAPCLSMRCLNRVQPFP